MSKKPTLKSQVELAIRNLIQGHEARKTNPFHFFDGSYVINRETGVINPKDFLTHFRAVYSTELNPNSNTINRSRQKVLQELRWCVKADAA